MDIGAESTTKVGRTVIAFRLTSDDSGFKGSKMCWFVINNRSSIFLTILPNFKISCIPLNSMGPHTLVITGEVGWTIVNGLEGCLNLLNVLDAKKLLCRPLNDFSTKRLDCAIRPKTLCGFIFPTNLEEELTGELWKQFDFVTVIFKNVFVGLFRTKRYRQFLPYRLQTLRLHK